jgi:hypothetical protein
MAARKSWLDRVQTRRILPEKEGIIPVNNKHKLKKRQQREI